MLMCAVKVWSKGTSSSPKGTSSKDVVGKVVWYLREKADVEDMKLPPANLLGPVLAVLYNCTPGQPPKFTQP